MKRTFAYIPLLLGVGAVYWIAHRASELPLDKMLADEARSHGVDVDQIAKWHTLENHLEKGSTGALSDQDWNEVKKLAKSSEPYVRAEGAKLLGKVKDGVHEEDAIKLAEKATKDPSDLVKAWGQKALQELKASP